MTTHFGTYLKQKELFWRNLRLFAFRNRTVFELFFILLYFGEQFILILLVNIWTKHIDIIIGLFALIVLTTFSLHRLVMESRIKLLEKKVISLENYNDGITEEAEEIEKKWNKVIRSYQELLTKKGLNNSKK